MLTPWTSFLNENITFVTGRKSTNAGPMAPYHMGIIKQKYIETALNFTKFKIFSLNAQN
jgi:hypothetical protein